MRIELKQITVKNLVEGYVNNDDNGVKGYGGLLNVRPPYQREFIYNDKQQKAVISSIIKGMPLNGMYWVLNEDGGYELLDGQQRTMSICNYIDGDFAIDFRYWHNLEECEKETILNYELMVYVCLDGTQQERLEWFNVINIAGEKLTKQELRNATYTGNFITDAKKKFSNRKSFISEKAYTRYMSGKLIRQDYLETVLKWVSNGNIEDYMAQHQHDDNAMELWDYYQNVIDWVNAIFPNYRKEMKGVDWGLLYNEHGGTYKNCEQEVKELMLDDDVTNKKGIYTYLFTGDTKHLSIRSFSDAMKRETYEKQNGICPHCKEHHDLSEMQGDHITPWSQGGKTTKDNLQMLCKKCNRTKSDK